jgi:hypothetical protein
MEIRRSLRREREFRAQDNVRLPEIDLVAELNPPGYGAKEGIRDKVPVRWRISSGDQVKTIIAGIGGRDGAVQVKADGSERPGSQCGLDGSGQQVGGGRVGDQLQRAVVHDERDRHGRDGPAQIMALLDLNRIQHECR